MIEKRTTKISFVIRAYNEEDYIGRLIQTILTQKHVDGDFEIIVVDSASNDSTVEIAKQSSVKLIEIPKDEFNYSYTLNLGIEQSVGGLIVILSAHAIPTTDSWLQTMLTNFTDKEVAGVYCRQVAWPDANVFEILRTKSYFPSETKAFQIDGSGEESHFSNAASCIRRSVWETHPFAILPAAEDREWAKWAIENNYTIIYDAKATVYHSHNESCREVAKRQIEIEKAKDIRLVRKRNLFLTIKQAVSWVLRNFRVIFSMKHFKIDHFIYYIKILPCGFWFILDFNRK